MTDCWPNDFTPMLELEKRKSLELYRVYCLTEKGWRKYSHPKSKEIAYIHAEVKQKEGYQVKITYKRRIIFETGEVWTSAK
jgi:hypothetical protein